MTKKRFNLSGFKGMNIATFAHASNEATEMINLKPTENGLEERNGAKTILSDIVDDYISVNEITYISDYTYDALKIDATTAVVVYGGTDDIIYARIVKTDEGYYPPTQIFGDNIIRLKIILIDSTHLLIVFNYANDILYINTYLISNNRITYINTNYIEIDISGGGRGYVFDIIELSTRNYACILSYGHTSQSNEYVKPYNVTIDTNYAITISNAGTPVEFL